MHFQISLLLRELQAIRDWLCVRDIAEISLNRLLLFLILKGSHRSYSVEKGVLKNFTGRHFCWSPFLIKLQAPSKKETLAQEFSCEFCEISKNTFFTNTSGRLLLENTAKCFKFLYYNHLLLCRANAAWGLQWRYREKRNDQEHHEKVSFFIQLNFEWFFLFVF